MANGEEGLVGGFMREVVEELFERGFLSPDVTPDFWREALLTWTPASAQRSYKLVLDEKALAAGVEGAITTPRDRCGRPEMDAVNGVVLNNIEGYRFG